MKLLVLVTLFAACGGSSDPDLAIAFDASAIDATPDVTADDSDGDGLSNEDEAALLVAYMPFLSVAADDMCPTSGLVARVTPAEVSGLVRIRYAWVFDRDCDVGYEGVDGSIALLVDPTKPSPAGIVGLRVVGRPATFCEQVSMCGTCSGELACEDLGGIPAVWAATDRHAIYATRSFSCRQTGGCIAVCEDAGASAAPPVVNVGEPDVPLVHDLTTQGFITTANGWTSTSLFDYDPFGGLDFGDAPALSTLLSGEDPPACPSS